LLSYTEDEKKATTCARLAEGSLGKALQYFHSGKLSTRDAVLNLLSAVAGSDYRIIFKGVDELESIPLGIHFLEHALHDLIMLPVDRTKLSNLDKFEQLQKLRISLGEPKLESLRASLKALQSLSGRPINAAYHLKALLASA